MGLRGDRSNEGLRVLGGSSVQEKTRKEGLGFLKVLGATPKSRPGNVWLFPRLYLPSEECGKDSLCGLGLGRARASRAAGVSARADPARAWGPGCTHSVRQLSLSPAWTKLLRHTWALSPETQTPKPGSASALPSARADPGDYQGGDTMALW